MSRVFNDYYFSKDYKQEEYQQDRREVELGNQQEQEEEENDL